MRGFGTYFALLAKEADSYETIPGAALVDQLCLHR